jgi:hypothetical protein
MNIISRLKYNWSFIRILFVVMGITILIQAISMIQWPGVFLGTYFLSMGVLGLGCAGGNCSVTIHTRKPEDGKKETVIYTEVK